MREGIRYLIPVVVLLLILVAAALVASTSVGRARVVAPLELTVRVTVTTVLR